MPGGHESDVLHRVAAHCPASGQLCLEAGKQLFDGSQFSGEEGVCMPALRHRLAALAGRGKDLSLEDQNPVKVVGECTCPRSPATLAPITTAEFEFSIMEPGVTKTG